MTTNIQTTRKMALSSIAYSFRAMCISCAEFHSGVIYGSASIAMFAGLISTDECVKIHNAASIACRRTVK